MATFYIQLENRLLQISGELTAENISKALGYVPVSPNVTNELSQRVDNITFDSLKDNPFLQDGSGELNIVDEAGNIIAKVSSEGIRTIEVLAGEHRLSEKANKSDLPTKLSDLDNDTNYITLADIPPVNIPSLDEYVTEEELNSKGYITQHQDISHLATKAEVSDIDFYNIKNNPVINSETGKLLFVDESGNIGLQLEDSGLFVADVFAGSHVLSNKADKSEVPTSTSQLTNDSGYITKPVVDQAIASLVDSAPETLDTIGEIASALKNNAGIVDVLNQSISNKQNTIEDLDAIRAGATKGATALQEIPEEYAKKEDIPSLDGYATQAWVNNKNYATEEDLSSIEFNSLQNNPLVEDSNGEFNLVDDLGNIGFKVNEEGLFVKDVIAGNHVLSNKANVSDIPAAVTESTVSGWGFTKNTGTYSKPSTGIPKSDLASAVQTSLGKADTALQSYTEQYKGTITGVSANGTPVATSGVANIPAASTSKYGVTKLSSATNSTSTTLAATPSAVKAAYDLANTYKGTVTKVKINGSEKSPDSNGLVDLGTIEGGVTDTSNFVKYDSTSIAHGIIADGIQSKEYSYVSLVLDRYGFSYRDEFDGNIDFTLAGDGTKFLSDDGTYKTISGGGPSSGSSAYSEVNHGTSDTTFTLTPNTFHIWDEVSALTLTLGSETSGVANEYLFQFTSGSTATALTLPDDIKWANDSAPTIAENKIYQVSILKGLASVLEFSNAAALIENKVTVSISGTKYLVSLQYAAASDIVVKLRTPDGPISVSISSGETSKTAKPIGPMVDSNVYIEEVTPAFDNNYNYMW